MAELDYNYVKELDDKELMLRAVEDYPVYTKRQRKMLGALVGLSTRGLVTTNVSSLVKVTGMANAAIYTLLGELEQDGAIARIGSPRAPVKAFALKYNRLHLMVESYLSKQEYLARKSV